MIIHSNIKKSLELELAQAKAIWIASAMISYSGWKFIQYHLPKAETQFYLIGIDLITDPQVFESILKDLEINARVYRTKYTFHPKVYLIKRGNDTLVAFIGSSNTTSWGLEKNVEMNFQINDQQECNKLIDWFKVLYSEGYLITDEFVNKYKSKFTSALIKAKQIEQVVDDLKNDLVENEGQFFSTNEHQVFQEKYHRKNSEDLQAIRKEVRNKFLLLHHEIYSQFTVYGLDDLHCHHQKREIVSRNYFNQYSGNYINAMWLHYGKSHKQLKVYKTLTEHSFINNIRMQVIIHENDIGIWLVLGKDQGSQRDRFHFRQQMNDANIRKKFFNAFKELGDSYSINVPSYKSSKHIKSPDELWFETQKEDINEYFIIGCRIGWLDQRLMKNNIANTILGEFKKLYPLYEIMRYK